MQFEDIENNCIQLNKYEIAIKDILELGYSLDTAASAYGLDIDYLSIFYHTIVSKGKVIKGRNQYISFFDELAFLLYVKICPQGHCVCLACFKEYFPRLIYPRLWDVCQKADETTKRRFLERNRNNISRLFSKNCLRLSPNNLLKKSLYLDEDIHECPPNFKGSQLYKQRNIEMPTQISPEYN